MKYILTLVTALVLTACGGGGGGGGGGGSATVPDPAPVALTRNITPTTRYISSVLDVRFDNDAPTIDGFPFPEDLGSIKKYIDHLKSVGYNVVKLQTNTPINLTTGKIGTVVSTCITTCDHRLPKYFWDFVDYAKRSGLKVFIDAQIVDVDTDLPLSTSLHNHTPPPGMTWAEVLHNAFQYQFNMAQRAETYKVDGWYVGHFNLGLDSESYRPLWQQHTDQLRSVFKGILLYASCDQCRNVVWSMVDQIEVYINPVLSQNKVYDSAQIVGLYHSTNVVANIQNIYQTYKKPISIRTMINLGDRATGQVVNPNLLITATGDGVYGYGTLAGANHISSFEADYALQSARITAFLTLVNVDLKDVVVGAFVNSYNPWGNGAWLHNACVTGDTICRAWQAYVKLADEMYRNPTAESVIKLFTAKLN
jgi:hypothetical protein